MHIGRCLLPEILKELNWTQQDLADKTGISRSHIADICRKRYVTMSLPTALKVAFATGRPVESLYEIFYDEEESR
ncbi:hypothetical protein BRE01_49330 [Brevibacillus reuszeri]|uniref:HTH cro/C1-type domain-containing protein n=1 Tax=Brevibacillus reuszeri TaxID=54915 RepID=A0A0K9YMY9_9BACL|nr:helix-turn-helix transcriptional regulator [Brevibacillus reuszeri]KNB69530.1 hypothetical protein ADS79_27075 [Brevibacillus reuszeri]MED1856105.1 helix-turn-helix transcriptional regulator [Brevibacillus reuszeri]GED71231.1 hypothetical protein BRE01_49330 [Brevibacillus reuszeri]